MARKPREQQGEEAGGADAGAYVSQAQFSQVDLVDASAPMVNQSPVMPSAAERDGRAEALAEVPPPKRYQVLQSQYVMAKGGRTLMRAGKIVDALNFDLQALVSQGVQLQELT